MPMPMPASVPRVQGAVASKALLLIAASLVVVLYVRFYFKAPPETQVLQTALAGLRPELLAERQPVLVEDRVHDVCEIPRNVLRLQYITLRCRRHVSLRPDAPATTHATATFISPHADATLVARRAGRRGGVDIKFLLRAHQTLCLPAHWTYRADSTGAVPLVDVAAVYDPLHLLLRPLAGLQAWV